MSAAVSAATAAAAAAAAAAEEEEEEREESVETDDRDRCCCCCCVGLVALFSAISLSTVEERREISALALEIAGAREDEEGEAPAADPDPKLQVWEQIYGFGGGF